MITSSKSLSLLLAISISVITTSFLSLVSGVSGYGLIVCFLIAFSSTYILAFIVFEFFIFAEINKIEGKLEKLKEEDFSIADHIELPQNNNILSRVNEEIFTYAKLKQQEIETLKKAEAFRREFIADISHELKTPIFAAQGFVHTLLDGAVKDKNVRTKFLKKAAKSLDGLDRLVQDLLTISKMETGAISMEFEVFNIHKLVTEVFDQFESKAEKRELKLAFHEDCPKDLLVSADRQRIYQVMLNLISNALKYKKEGQGMVEVNLVDKNDKVFIYVKDNGTGIPSEHLKRIFERFYRVEKSRSKDKGGSGLGLSIVKHIIEAHNSQIKVASKYGEGSTFWFHLEKATELEIGI